MSFLGELFSILDPEGRVAFPGASGGYDVGVPLTLPTPAAAYAAGDVVGGRFEIPKIGRDGASIMVSKTDLELDISAVPSGMSSFRLHLYNAAPPSNYADNAPWGITAQDRPMYLGYLDLGSPLLMGVAPSTLFVKAAQDNEQFRMVSTSLFAYLVTSTGYTPAAGGEVYKPTLHSVNL